jgi:uncharacterized RDD family membrane protein YckC
LRSDARARYKSSMSDGEPSLLRDPAGGPTRPQDEDSTAPISSSPSSSPSGPRPATPSAAPALEPPRPLGRQAPVVHVVGFWKRGLAAAIDLAVVIPLAALLVLVVGKIAGVHLPHRLGPLDIDMWIDLVLATDPALVMGATMFVAIGLVYLLVFHIVLGRTLGMRLLRIRVIDVYGDRPSPGRCVARCAGYLAGVATLFLGFLWMGFDSEKRGLQDWIAGTYVIRA